MARRRNDAEQVRAPKPKGRSAARRGSPGGRSGGSGSGSTPKDRAATAPTPSEARHGEARAWVDSLVLAFVLAMFVRVFVFELFKVPTGSMIPTIIGAEVADVDLDDDGDLDLIALIGRSGLALTFIREGDHYEQGGRAQFPTQWLRKLRREKKLRRQHDRIFVNKFAYWFGHPDRGDIVVFKVPKIIFDPAKPIYIKRLVGLPGDDIRFDAEGRIGWEGLAVEDGPDGDQLDFFSRQKYVPAATIGPQLHRFKFVDYGEPRLGQLPIRRIRVPEDGYYVFGDNTNSSLDSRYWGAFPTNHLKGKAAFRYWPWSQMKFLR